MLLDSVTAVTSPLTTSGWLHTISGRKSKDGLLAIWKGFHITEDSFCLIYWLKLHSVDNIAQERITFAKRTVFENHRKKYHWTLRAKRATFTFWVDKSSLKMPKLVQFGEFLKTSSLRSNSVTRHVSFNRTKIGENAKIQKFKCDILSTFQTLYKIRNYKFWSTMQLLTPKF